MANELLPARPIRRPPTGRTETPDLAVTALPLFQRLRDALAVAGRFRESCRRLEHRAARRWAEPAVFFFDSLPPIPSERPRPDRPSVPDQVIKEVALLDPRGEQSWNDLADLCDDALALLAASATVRHAARAVPRLVPLATSLAAYHAGARRVAEVLAIPDDQVIVAVHPEARTGVRALVRGVADVGHLHRLLTQVVTDPSSAGVDRDRPELFFDHDAENNWARDCWFQLFPRSALGPDGRLPTDFTAVDRWLWQIDPLTRIPLENGERIVLLGKPIGSGAASPVQRPSWIPGEMEVLERMSAQVVGRWLESRTGIAVSVPRPFRVAA